MKGAIDDKKVNAIEYITQVISPAQGNKYFIIDPYLDVVGEIQEPIKSSKLESTVWSFLLSELASVNTTFQIITRQPVDDISAKGQFPPYTLPTSPQINNVPIQVCKYIDNKYYDTAMHDRLILCEGDGGLAGVHIGPSLSDISDKDVSITPYSPPTIKVALGAFNDLWKACIINKEWRK